MTNSYLVRSLERAQRQDLELAEAIIAFGELFHANETTDPPVGTPTEELPVMRLMQATRRVYRVIESKIDRSLTALEKARVHMILYEKIGPLDDAIHRLDAVTPSYPEPEGGDTAARLAALDAARAANPALDANTVAMDALMSVLSLLGEDVARLMDEFKANKPLPRGKLPRHMKVLRKPLPFLDYMCHDPHLWDAVLRENDEAPRLENLLLELRAVERPSPVIASRVSQVLLELDRAQEALDNLEGVYGPLVEGTRAMALARLGRHEEVLKMNPNVHQAARARLLREKGPKHDA